MNRGHTGYWLANIGFWASVLRQRQVWLAAVAEDEATFAAESVDFEPSIPDDCLNIVCFLHRCKKHTMSMDFFTFRFLHGAAC